ncbi:DNA-dependent protein kinase catalytic subunit [Cricetulus griseus]|uniref:DNA-dependent protein kinase catalytic subunit n=1 Tax=Cricetulus griseus TaxID=10029 RepID=A0A061I7G7_CRIGR|nr:DNA-dependent protein kinase catalytic subunit [Cricetulus griseus]
MPEGQGCPPMYQLYKHTFPALLQLACDVDQVTRQLYEPLVMQLIHWFTNNKKFESQDTVALLETILDGIVDPVDSTLRDFCGCCIREFLKWSIKQTTPQQQEKSPVNSKSLFKRLYSLALHPNAFKRLGAALAFNHIYKEFREEESLVEQFVFEALVTYMESLALAHADEKSLGNKSPSLWLKDLIKTEAISFLINTFEGGDSSCDQPAGILAQPTLFHLQGPISLRAVLQWLDMLLAALECYNTFIEKKTVEIQEVLGTKTQSSLLKSVAFFLESIATHDARAVEQRFGTGVTTGPPSLQEEEKYNYSKCTVLVRIVDFTTTLLNASPEVFKSTALTDSIGMRLLSLVYNGIAPAEERQCLQSLDPSCKSLANGLLELAFAYEGLIDSALSFDTNHSSFPEIFTTYASLLADTELGLHLKGQAIILLPFFTSLTEDRLENLKHILEKLIVSNFPMKSDEFPPDSLKYNNYVDCMKKFLDALELSQSPMLLQLMTDILCREQQHIMEELFQTTFKRIAKRSPHVTQLNLLQSVYTMFRKDDLPSNVTRQAFVDRSLLTLLWHCDLDTLKEFFSRIVVDAIDVLKSRFTKVNEFTFDTQITKKMCYYKMLAVMYSRLSKDDVHSKESKINQAFHGSCITEGNELTKILLKSCHDAFTENMAGESQLLEKRRLYHCAAYNCAISVICCVFNELKFYQGFLFSEKPEKVPMERKKKYIEIRKEARDAANGASGGSVPLLDSSGALLGVGMAKAPVVTDVVRDGLWCGKADPRYFEALVNNMFFVKYKEVYAAAAEVLGLILQHVTERKQVIAESVCELVVKQLKQHQNTMEDKFIVCLNKVVKGFPPLADSFLNAVFFLLPKFHGVMKTLCLEVVLCRAETTTDLYLQLKSKDFLQVMRHRDDERQKVCLDIVYKMMAELKPVELRELLNPVMEFVSHPSPACREQMYNILMWIHDNYRLIIRNFWSHETRLPSNTLDRLLALNSLYSPKIEVHFLSLATNFLLEMTRMSPDYLNPIFEHPLSECEFQEYTIDPDWRFRSTVLTPMFIETQASPSILHTQTQEGSLSDRRQKSGQVRATQQQYDFTPTQTIVERSSFDWLTGSSIDPLADHTLVPSESSSSSLLFAHKRSEKSQRISWKSVGPDFGIKKLGLPGDEVDNQAKSGTYNRAEILRLRRRFLKDREKLSLLYAKKGLVEQKLEKDIKSELKTKQNAQVVLYRSYRYGDLPDIQILHSSLITPLQAVAQKDPIIAKQLFSSLFSGILKEMNKFKATSEKNIIIQNLLQDFNRFLNTTFLFFPPFVSCIQEICCQYPGLLSLDPAAVRVGCLASLQQPGGIRLLEEALLRLVPDEPPIKRVRGKTCWPPDVLRWMELAKLYRSIGEYDILRGIFSSELGTKQDTRNALLAEARSDYSQAAKLYNEALNKQEWVDGEPTEAEKEFWELASLDCYNNLSEWKALEYCSTTSIGSENPLDLSKMWSELFYQEMYLPYVIRSKLKLLLNGEGNQSLLTFVDEAMHKELQQTVLELHYSQELSLLYILQDDIDRATYYIKNGIQIFMQNYSSIDVLLHRSRLAKLQSVQTLAEIEEFLNFISKHGDLSSPGPLRRLLKTWTSRYPDAVTDPMHIWDDIITNRCFFLSKIEERLTASSGDLSMSVDEDEDSLDRREVHEPKEDVHSMIQSCRFTMKMKMIESAWKQKNFSLAMKLLKELHKDSKTRETWQVQWTQSYCQLSHSKSRTQSSREQVLTALKTIPLLDDSNMSSYFNKNIQASCNQNILLGTTFRFMADALNREPACLSDLEETKAKSVLALSGSDAESTEKVISGLYQRAFHYFSKAVQLAEEEDLLSCWGHEAAAEQAHAYMTLVGFCDQQLRKVEESASNTSQKRCAELEAYPALVVEKLLRALKLNSSEARLKFPRLLQIIEQYSEETLNIMTKEISSIPCWQFIGWISHMVALLDKEEAIAVQHTVEEIADNYPQAIIYPFIISSESYSFKQTSSGCKNKAFVERIKSKLDQVREIQDFINALDQLSNPDMIFKDWIDDTKVELEKNPVNKNNIEKLYQRMHTALGDLEAPWLGPFRKRFIQAFGKEFDKSFGNNGSKLPTMKFGDFCNITDSLLRRMRKDSKPPGNLKEYSPKMSEFKGNELEIPGQYDGRGKPLPEYHVRISGFDERVKVMVSLRKPKRIVIRGHDEKEYPFLVKGGEDLRQDQRIEQLFEVMNAILAQDAACSQRNMQLRTYRVMPMTCRLGLIEWIENTTTLKDLLLSSMSKEEKEAYNSDPKAPIREYKDWLKQITKKSDAGAYLLMYKGANRTETVTAFRKRENKVPADLLKRAFVKMSTNPEAFLALRSHFASSHALLCISHWLLGIGDRHLNNFMVAMETGSVIGIDFGHAFGSATQCLPVPELMPFRLTRQFVSLMLPMKETGLVCAVMVYALRAFRSCADLLTDTMDVFVKEPFFYWKSDEQKMLKKGGSWIQEINVTEENWYPQQKIRYAKRKLAGANPAVITCDELRLGHESSPAFGSYTAVARGHKNHNIRAQEPESGLSEETQVKCLVDQATDPNILGRTWEGWEPWM